MGAGGRLGIHGAAFAVGIDEGVEADLGDDAGPLGGGLAHHVEHDAGGHVVGGISLAPSICQIIGGSDVDGPEG